MKKKSAISPSLIQWRKEVVIPKSCVPMVSSISQKRV
jgi:hypothetical protein